jgi:dihydroneopterin aldolase
LAETIAFKILENKIVEKVEVKITKPDIWGDCSPGVHISRS